MAREWQSAYLRCALLARSIAHRLAPHRQRRGSGRHKLPQARIARAVPARSTPGMGFAMRTQPYANRTHHRPIRTRAAVPVFLDGRLRRRGPCQQPRRTGGDEPVQRPLAAAGRRLRIARAHGHPHHPRKRRLARLHGRRRGSGKAPARAHRAGGRQVRPAGDLDAASLRRAGRRRPVRCRLPVAFRRLLRRGRAQPAGHRGFGRRAARVPAHQRDLFSQLGRQQHLADPSLPARLAGARLRAQVQPGARRAPGHGCAVGDLPRRAHRAHRSPGARGARGRPARLGRRGASPRRRAIPGLGQALRQAGAGPGRCAALSRPARSAIG